MKWIVEMDMMKPYGANGPLSDPPELGQYVVVPEFMAQQHAIKVGMISDQYGYERGQRDMLAKCIAVLDAHHPRCTEPCDLCAEWSAMRDDLEAMADKP